MELFSGAQDAKAERRFAYIAKLMVGTGCHIGAEVLTHFIEGEDGQTISGVTLV